MNKIVIKRIIGAIGVIALINVGVFSYLHFTSSKIASLEQKDEITDTAFQSGNWEMKSTRGDLVIDPRMTCLTGDEIKELYSEESRLKELASYFCKTEIAQINRGYEIKGTACREKSAEFSILVRYQKIADNAFSVDWMFKSRVPEKNFTETTEIRRLGDCE